MILQNGKQVTGIYIGDKAVSAVYHGENLVWQKKQDEDQFLRYWWSGNDPLVNGKLVDRMGSGIDWYLYGAPVWTGTEYVFDSTARYGEYPNCRDFDLGHHFKVVLDADLKTGVHSVDSAFLDLGSVTSAQKNIGFSYTTAGVSFNWKMTGNDSNPGITCAKDATYPPDFVLPAGVWTAVNLTVEMRDRGNGYDECFIKDRANEFIFQENVPKVEYSGFINRAATLSKGYLQEYGIGMKLRNLKIYVYD